MRCYAAELRAGQGSAGGCGAGSFDHSVKLDVRFILRCIGGIMFGWFSKKPSEAKAKGSEAGRFVRAQIEGEFVLSDYIENGELSHPTGFLSDPYIVGFIHGYIIILADVSSAARGKTWSQSEANEFVLSAVETAVGSGSVGEFIKGPRKYKDSSEYNSAYLAANTMVKALYASSALDGDNVLVKKANSLIEDRKEYVAEAFPKSRKGEVIAWAVKEITIKQHIHQRYLS